MKLELTTAIPERGEPEAMLADFQGDYPVVFKRFGGMEVMIEFKPDDHTIYKKDPVTRLVSWGSVDYFKRHDVELYKLYKLVEFAELVGDVR